MDTKKLLPLLLTVLAVIMSSGAIAQDYSFQQPVIYEPFEGQNFTNLDTELFIDYNNEFNNITRAWYGVNGVFTQIDNRSLLQLIVTGIDNSDFSQWAFTYNEDENFLYAPGVNVYDPETLTIQDTISFDNYSSDFTAASFTYNDGYLFSVDDNTSNIYQHNATSGSYVTKYDLAGTPASSEQWRSITDNGTDYFAIGRATNIIHIFNQSFDYQGNITLPEAGYFEMVNVKDGFWYWDSTWTNVSKIDMNGSYIYEDVILPTNITGYGGSILRGGAYDGSNLYLMDGNASIPFKMAEREFADQRITDPGFNEGNNTVSVRLEDSGTNYTTTTTVNFEVIPLELSVSKPENNTYFERKIPFKYSTNRLHDDLKELKVSKNSETPESMNVFQKKFNVDDCTTSTQRGYYYDDQSNKVYIAGPDGANDVIEVVDMDTCTTSDESLSGITLTYAIDISRSSDNTKWYVIDAFSGVEVFNNSFDHVGSMTHPDFGSEFYPYRVDSYEGKAYITGGFNNNITTLFEYNESNYSFIGKKDLYGKGRGYDGRGIAIVNETIYVSLNDGDNDSISLYDYDTGWYLGEQFSFSNNPDDERLLWISKSQYSKKLYAETIGDVNSSNIGNVYEVATGYGSGLFYDKVPFESSGDYDLSFTMTDDYGQIDTVSKSVSIDLSTIGVTIEKPVDGSKYGVSDYDKTFDVVLDEPSSRFFYTLNGVTDYLIDYSSYNISPLINTYNVDDDQLTIPFEIEGDYAYLITISNSTNSIYGSGFWCGYTKVDRRTGEFVERIDNLGACVSGIENAAIEYDEDGFFWIGHWQDNTVRRYSKNFDNTGLNFTFNRPATTGTAYNKPTDIEVYEGIVYVTNYASYYVHKYNKTDGSYQGNLTLSEDFVSTMAISDGVIYTSYDGSTSKNIYAYNLSTGALIKNYGNPTTYYTVVNSYEDGIMVSDVDYSGNVISNNILDAEFETPSSNYVGTLSNVQKSNSLTFYAEDANTTSRTGSESISFNYYEAPNMDYANITPNLVTEDTEMVGSCKANDPNSLNIQYEYQWIVNGNIADDGTGSSGNLASGTVFSTSYADGLLEGENWTFKCRAKNAYSTSDYLNDSKVIGPNSVPVPTATLNSPVYDFNDTLEASCSATDENGDQVSYDWILYNNSIAFETGSTSFVAEGTTINVANVTEEGLFIGDNWTLSCRATDGTDYSNYTNSSTVTVQKFERPPVVQYSRLYPIILFNDTSLSAKAMAEDPNGDSLDYNFKLYVNNDNVENQTNNSIEGVEVAASFDYNNLSNGDEVRVGVVAGDGVENSSEESSLTFTVRASNNAPVVQKASIEPITLITEDKSLKGYCNATDSEGDTLGYNYKWYNGSTVIKSGNTTTGSYLGYTEGYRVLVDTLSSSKTSAGDSIVFSCQAFDAVNTSSYKNSTSRKIYSGTKNDPPVIESFKLQPSGDQYGNVSIGVYSKASDFEDEELTFEYWVYRNDRTFSSSIKTLSIGTQHLLTTIDSSNTNVGDEWYARVRVTDSDGDYAQKNSARISILNTVPIMNSSVITSDGYENESLSGSCTATDIDDQEITFNKKWYRDGTLAYEGSTVPRTLTTAGEDWIMSCQANDSIDNSDYLNSTSVTIIDTSTAPVIKKASINGDSNTLNLSCLATDVEGDNIDYTFEWLRNGVTADSTNFDNVTQGIEQSLEISPTITQGDNWTFECTATDIDGSDVESDTLQIPTVDFSAYLYDKTETSATFRWSGNQDSVKLYRNGSLITTSTSSSYEFTGLYPATTYNFTIVPLIDSFTGDSDTFIVTTDSSDNQAPVMKTARLKPELPKTNTDLKGYCNASDVDNRKVFYKFEWLLNGSSIKSGNTKLYSKDFETLVDTLDSSKFEYNDVINFTCTANDGLFDSKTLHKSTTVQNSVPSIDNEIIDINMTYYECVYEYSDADGQSPAFINYSWYRNGNLTSYTNKSLDSDLFDSGDELVCNIKTGDGITNVTSNTSVFKVGDFQDPVMKDFVYPTSLKTSDAREFSVTCSDDVSIAKDYPKVRFTNPNGEEKSYVLENSGGDYYKRTLTLPIVGEYTGLEFECRDGSSNSVLETFDETIFVRSPDTTVIVGGGGGAGDEEPERNITSFTVDPEGVVKSIAPGNSDFVELEITNEDVVDLDFNAIITRSDEYPETYDWMSFEGGRKQVDLTVEKRGSIAGNTRFLRYDIEVPENVTNGEYTGLVEVSTEVAGETKVIIHEVTIDTTNGGFNLLGILQTDLFTIGGTRTPTGEVTGGGEEITERVGGFDVTVGFAIVLVLGTLILIGFYRAVRP